MASFEHNSEQNFDVESIWRKYSLFVYRLCLRLTREKTSAEDLRQDVFIRIMAKGSAFRGDADIKTWIYSVTRNCCMDYFRWERRQLLTHMDHSDFDVMPQIGSLCVADSLGCSWDSSSRLDSCNPMERTFLELHFNESMSYGDIALLFGFSRTAVGKKINKALLSIKNKEP